MGAWSLSPPPNVPGSGPHCISNEIAALTYVCISVTDVVVCASQYGTGSWPRSDLFVPCHHLEKYKALLEKHLMTDKHIYYTGLTQRGLQILSLCSQRETRSIKGVN